MGGPIRDKSVLPIWTPQAPRRGDERSEESTESAQRQFGKDADLDARSAQVPETMPLWGRPWLARCLLVPDGVGSCQASSRRADLALRKCLLFPIAAVQIKRKLRKRRAANSGHSRSVGLRLYLAGPP